MRTSDESAARASARIAAFLTSRGDDASLHGLDAVQEVEKHLRAWYGKPYIVCVSSATSGLDAVAHVLDLQERSQFIAPGFVWGGAVAPFLHRGLRPQFGDVETSTLTLSPESARRLATKRTKVLLAADYLGYAADTRGLRDLADDLGLWYIADAAYGFGATRDGAPAGSLADVTVLSFGQGKPLFAGEGGAIVTSQRSLYEKLLWWTQHPARQIRELGPSLRNEFGTNARMHPVAAIWLAETFEAQVDDLRRRQARRAEILEALGASDIVEVTPQDPGMQPAGTHILARLKRGRTEHDVTVFLRRIGTDAIAQLLPTRQVLDQPAFHAQFGGRRHRPGRQRLEWDRFVCIPIAATDETQRLLPFSMSTDCRASA